MLEQKVKLTAVGELVSYPKRENGVIVKDEQGQDVTGGCWRQLTFESLDFKKDIIPITIFNDEAKDFNFKVETVGELQFQCEKREKPQTEGPTRLYPELRMVNFNPEKR